MFIYVYLSLLMLSRGALFGFRHGRKCSSRLQNILYSAGIARLTLSLHQAFRSLT